MSSLWSDIVGSIKTLIQSENDSQEADVRWVNVETKFFQLISLLKERNERVKNLTTLSDVSTILEKNIVFEVNDTATFFRVRSIFLELWRLLLYEVIMANKRPQANFSNNDIILFHKIIGNLIGRKEFDLKYMKIDRNSPNFSELDVKSARKYRDLLYETHSYFQNSIKQKVESHQMLTSLNILFYAKVLSVSSFRIPKVMKFVLSSISLHEEEFNLISKALHGLFFQYIHEDDSFYHHQSSPIHSSSHPIPIADDDPTSLSSLIDLNPDIDITEKELIFDDHHLSNNNNNNNSNVNNDKNNDNDDKNDDKNDKIENDANKDIIDGREVKKMIMTNDRAKDDSHLFIGSKSLPSSPSPLSSSSLSLSSSSSSEKFERSIANQKQFSSIDGIILNERKGRNRGMSYSQLQMRELPKLTSQSSAEFDKLCKMIKLYPSLFEWSQFHSILIGREEDNYDNKIKDGIWLDQLQKRDAFFFSYIDHWILHAISIAKLASNVDWFSVKGYRLIIPSFIYAMKCTSLENFSKELLDCSKSALLTLPSLINFYIHHLFSMTNAFDIHNTLASISVVGKWFTHLIANQLYLPNDFDIQFFCKGIDILFHSDHHQIMLATLSFLYENAEVFDGSNRTTLFVDLLLHKYFFHLFLHWDYCVRNSFQQFLIFKFIKRKRAQVMISSLSNSMEEATDVLIHGKIQSYILMVKEKVCPSHLLVYASNSLAEYQAYFNLYKEWEGKDSKKPQKLIPFNILPKSYKVKDYDTRRIIK